METSRLWQALAGKRQKSTRGVYFVTYADQKAIFTEVAIRHLVAELKYPLEHRLRLEKTLYEKGTTILAILVWMKEVDSILDFTQHEVLDPQLPLDENRAIQIAPRFGSSLAKEVQWQFLPYVFESYMCEMHLVIQEANILPFVKEERLGAGSFGVVDKITLPYSQHEFELGSYEVRLITNPNNLCTNCSTQSSDYSSIVRKRIVRTKPQAMTQAIQQELRCLLLLHRSSHPNIVPFLGSYEMGNEHNFLFPCFDMDLNEMLKREDRFGNFEWDFTFFAALSGLASAMNNLHELELTPEVDDMELVAIGYHHDFRPANILVSRETFFLTDFGLSKLLPEDQTSQATWKNTTGDYIAPECMGADFEPQKVGRPVDTWALGCLLFEVATYMERGPEGLTQFRKNRRGPGLAEGWIDQQFSGKDGIRRAVLEWRQELMAHPKIPFLADLLQIAIDTLEINPLSRPKAGVINKWILFPSVKAHFGAMQSAFSEYIELAIRQSGNNTPPKEIFHEKERVHAFGSVLGLDQDHQFFYPRPQDMEVMCNTLNTLFYIFRSKISQILNNNVSSSIGQAVRANVESLWNQVPHKFKKDMEKELKSREQAFLNWLLQGEESHAKGGEIFSDKVMLETFAWIHRNPKYEDWLETNSSRLLWVLKAGGRGKTVLTSFLLGELNRRPQSRKNAVPIVTRVFCGIRSADKKDVTWILRNIIHQLLMNDKVSMQKHGLPAYERRRRENPVWTFETASQLFHGVMRDRKSPVYLILDLFDESERTSQGLLLDTLGSFLNCQDPAPPFKVIIITKEHSKSSRHLDGRPQTEITWGEVEIRGSTKPKDDIRGTGDSNATEETDSGEDCDESESGDESPIPPHFGDHAPIHTPLPTHPTSLCHRNSIAACNWAVWNYRVYFQDSQQSIQEASKALDNWNLKSGHMGINDAKSNTPLAVITRFNGDNREVSRSFKSVQRQF